MRRLNDIYFAIASEHCFVLKRNFSLKTRLQNIVRRRKIFGESGTGIVESSESKTCIDSLFLDDLNASGKNVAQKKRISVQIEIKVSRL